MKHNCFHNKSYLATIFCCFLLFGPAISQAQQQIKVRIVQGNNSIESYAKGLLRLVFSKIPDKNYVIDDKIPNTSEERIVTMLMDNQLEVAWYATTNNLEERLLPIRICIYRGLLGYRVLMIKQGTQHKFDGIKNLEDLKRVSLGQGRFWADTNVLTANQLNVVKVMKYESLFYMLDGGRFDGYPRGVHEPWSEIQRYPKLALDVEDNLLLSYVNPFYFFVSKSNTMLANDLERGLRTALADGSFEQYFLNDPTVKDAIEKSNLKNRILIRLDNPTLPPKTPSDDKSLWFDPYSL